MFYQKRENPGELRNPKNPWKSEKLGNSKILWIREKPGKPKEFSENSGKSEKPKKATRPKNSGELEKLGK